MYHHPIAQVLIHGGEVVRGRQAIIHKLVQVADSHRGITVVYQAQNVDCQPMGSVSLSCRRPSTLKPCS